MSKPKFLPLHPLFSPQPKKFFDSVFCLPVLLAKRVYPFFGKKLPRHSEGWTWVGGVNVAQFLHQPLIPGFPLHDRRAGITDQLSCLTAEPFPPLPHCWPCCLYISHLPTCENTERADEETGKSRGKHNVSLSMSLA